jgi:hypothetical protein
MYLSLIAYFGVTEEAEPHHLRLPRELVTQLLGGLPNGTKSVAVFHFGYPAYDLEPSC